MDAGGLKSEANSLLSQKLGTLEDPRPITKSGVRILRPDEYQRLWEAASRPVWYGCEGSDGQIILDALLKTGLRYVESQRFQRKSEWFDRRFIYLPKEAVEKHKRKQLDRWVRLNVSGVRAVESFLLIGSKVPSWWTWTDALKKWASAGGLDPIGLGPKTTRKTWESWLIFSYPEHWLQILLSQGHTSATSINHYLNLPFLEEDKEAMKPFVQGWI